MTNKKATYGLPSFTLTEVIVAMVIMSFVAYIAYSIFLKTGSMVESAKEDQNENLEAIELYSSLAYDISHACFVDIPASYAIDIENEVKHNIRYEIHNHYMLRKASTHIDTFYVRVKMLSTAHKQEKLVSLQLLQENDTIPFVFGMPQESADRCNIEIGKSSFNTIWK